MTSSIDTQEEPTPYPTGRKQVVPVTAVVKIVVSDECAEKYPCGHNSVQLVFSDGTVRNIGGHNGQQIALLFRAHGLKVPEHFQGYV